MECEIEVETEQDAKIAIISDPVHPCKREREEHEAIHAQYRNWRVTYV